MKKIILFAGLLFASLTQAQTITATADGEPITEGQTFTFNTLDEEISTLSLLATNVTDAPVYIKLKVNTITNADGEDVQFCFGNLCYFSIDEGDTVPTNNQLQAIQPGGTNNVNDHFWNNNPGIVVGQDVVYNLSFIEVTQAGVETATLLTFNYRYSPTASVSTIAGLQNMGISLKNTVVKNQLDVTATAGATLQLFTTNGQMVKTAAIVSGAQSIDVATLSTGVYIARFTTEGNKTSSVRIVKN